MNEDGDVDTVGGGSMHPEEQEGSKGCSSVAEYNARFPTKIPKSRA